MSFLCLPILLSICFWYLTKLIPYFRSFFEIISEILFSWHASSHISMCICLPFPSLFGSDDKFLITNTVLFKYIFFFLFNWWLYLNSRYLNKSSFYIRWCVKFRELCKLLCYVDYRAVFAFVIYWVNGNGKVQSILELKLELFE